MSERWHLRVDKLVLVCCWYSRGIERDSSSIWGLNHVWAELHWFLDHCWRYHAVISTNLPYCVQVVIKIVLASSDPINRSSGISLVLVPRASSLPMRRDHMHWLVICIDRSWLSPALLESLGLILESLSVLLVGLYQLNFLLRPFVAWGWLARLLVLKGYLFLGEAVSVWGLERWGDSVHTKLHEVWLRSIWSIGILSSWWVLMLRRCHTTT